MDWVTLRTRKADETYPTAGFRREVLKDRPPAVTGIYFNTGPMKMEN